MVYLWTEDIASGFTFWKFICKNIFGDKVEVVSKGSISKLTTAVEKLEDTENKYILAIDNAYDNKNVCISIDRIENCIEDKDNILILNIYCFEYIILTFKYLYNWLNKQIDLEKRELELEVLKGVLSILSEGFEITPVDALDIVKKYKTKLGANKVYSVESLCASILKRLTQNSGFIVDKGHFGDCWCKDCCTSETFHNCEINKTESNKAVTLYNNTCLLNAMIGIRGRFDI